MNIQPRTRTILILTLICSSLANAHASALLECRDDRLPTISAEALRTELNNAGARNCEVRRAAWGESIACQGTTPGTRAFGLSVRELSAEIQRESGQRSIQIVTAHNRSTVERAVSAAPAPAGMERIIESEETGVTVISCMASSA